MPMSGIQFTNRQAEYRHHHSIHHGPVIQQGFTSIPGARVVMDRRLTLVLLLILPLFATAQTGSFSLPGVGDLQKQLTETSDKKSDGTENPDKEQLRDTIKFRQEIDSNREQIEDLKQFASDAPAKRTRLEAELTRLRQERNTDWGKHYQDNTLQELIQALVAQLDALEKNQEDLAEANSEPARKPAGTGAKRHQPGHGSHGYHPHPPESGVDRTVKTCRRANPQPEHRTQGIEAALNGITRNWPSSTNNGMWPACVNKPTSWNKISSKPVRCPAATDQ